MERPKPTSATDESEEKSSPLSYTCSRPIRPLHHENHIGSHLLAIPATTFQPRREALARRLRLLDSTRSDPSCAAVTRAPKRCTAKPTGSTSRDASDTSSGFACANLRGQPGNACLAAGGETKKGHGARFPRRKGCHAVHVKRVHMLHLATIRTVTAVRSPLLTRAQGSSSSFGSPFLLLSFSPLSTDP